MTHPLRGSLLFGALWGLTAALVIGGLAGAASFSPLDGLALAGIIAPAWIVGGMLLFGPIVVFWNRHLERRTRS